MARSAMLHRGAVDADPVAVTVRYHDESKRVGDLAGTNLSYAEVMERPAQLVFWNAELDTAAVSLDRGMYVVLTATEGYFLDVIHPRDGLTTKADVTPMRTDELTGKTLPDGTIIP